MYRLPNATDKSSTGTEKHIYNWSNTDSIKQPKKFPSDKIKQKQHYKNSHCISCGCSLIIKEQSTFILVYTLSFFFHALQSLINLTRQNKEGTLPYIYVFNCCNPLTAGFILGDKGGNIIHLGHSDHL